MKVYQASAGDGGGWLWIKQLKLMRLGRLVRVLRFKFFEDLRTMVLGVVAGTMVLFWAIILLLFVIYFLAVFLNNLFGDEEEEFKNVPVAMLTVFRCYTDGCSAYNGTPLTVRL